MAVYVDELFETAISEKWPFTSACHMIADTEEELHEMAQRIGLKRGWHQSYPPHSISHYDLTRGKRWQAIRNGAIEVDSRFIPSRRTK